MALQSPLPSSKKLLNNLSEIVLDTIARLYLQLIQFKKDNIIMLKSTTTKKITKSKLINKILSVFQLAYHSHILITAFSYNHYNQSRIQFQYQQTIWNFQSGSNLIYISSFGFLPLLRTKRLAKMLRLRGLDAQLNNFQLGGISPNLL